MAAEELLRRARERNVRIENPNKHPRAFTMVADQHDSDMHSALFSQNISVRRAPTVLDPMAGGGTIPFESLRLGLTTLAGELNPVACTVLQGYTGLSADPRRLT